MLKLSYNNTSTFRSCPKKFEWRYVHGLEPITREAMVSIGAIVHEAFDMFYKGLDDDEIIKHIGSEFDEEISKAELTDREELVIGKYTALGMWTYYPHKNLKEFDEIFSEEEYIIDLGNDICFNGKVDGRILKDKAWWVRELKTTGLDYRRFEQRCQHSPQGTGYVYGLIKNGHDIKGLMYEYIKRPLLRKGVNETAEQFGKRIMQDYKARPKLYYARHYSYRNQTDLMIFENDLKLLSDEIRRKIASGEFYRNADSCFSFGKPCPYYHICFADKPDPLTLELYYTVKGGKNEYRRSENGDTSDIE